MPLPYGLALISAIASSTVSARDGEHRAEDLVAVGVHRRGHVVEHARADEEPLLVPGHDQTSSVDGEPRTLLLARADVAGDAVAGLARHDRPHLARRVAARPTFIAEAFADTASTRASPASPTVTAAEIAMQRSPAEPNAAATRWSDA